jgi:outer membrane protein assembly factor BamB
MRLWPGILLIALYWGLFVANRLIDTTISSHFFTSVIGPGVIFLLFLVWWLTSRGIRLADRFVGLGAVVAGSWLAARWSDPSIGLFTVLMYALPVGLTLWVVWLLLGGRRSAFVKRYGAALSLLPIWGLCLIVRMTSLYGDLTADFQWRWIPTAEERLIAARARAAAEQPASARLIKPPASPLVFHPGDWPGLRGKDRNGVVQGVQIATDWEKSPPKSIWHEKIGPGWSSFAVIGDRLFTQEQLGDKEAVVCLDAATGHEVWVHEDTARNWDSQGGAGPRATPTFDDGRIYSIGATGILNCLDAASGDLKWTRVVATDAKTEIPMWGFCGSPIVVGGVVIVYAGGGEKGLVAYRADSGEPAWIAATGKQGYSSPQLVSIGGENQVLLFDDGGLIAVDPASGKLRWRHDAPTHDWRAAQPHAIGDSEIMFGSGDLGLVLLDLKRGESEWSAARRWATRSLKPEYNDFVVLDDSVYGFDGGIFACVDAKTGERRWKGGRYGHGQVLLLAEQRLLLVLSEMGEAVLLAANPKKLEELGKFQAIEGKTWNHPVVAHGRLYVRNDQEMACYELTPNAEDHVTKE